MKTILFILTLFSFKVAHAGEALPINKMTDLKITGLPSSIKTSANVEYREAKTLAIEFKTSRIEAEKDEELLRERCEQELYKMRKALNLLDPWVPHVTQGCVLTSRFMNGATDVFGATASIEIRDPKMGKKIAEANLESCKAIAEAKVEEMNQQAEQWSAPDAKTDLGMWCLGVKGALTEPSGSGLKKAPGKR